MVAGDSATERSHRYRANLERMRDGDRDQVAEVERVLAAREPDPGQARGEQRMLAAARNFLADAPGSS